MLWQKVTDIYSSTVTSWFHRFVNDNDLPYVSIHGLRHTNASIMISRGVPITTAAKRLGHTTAATLCSRDSFCGCQDC
ncbi:MAG: tyrosine-type recombinase/integrase [Oribacterium sp.]|nr:tyrosine-type recombinase/integrase [Oribacterium sp.]